MKRIAKNGCARERDRTFSGLADKSVLAADGGPLDEGLAEAVAPRSA